MDKRILGIDFGNVRIGVAVSDPLRIIAQTVGTFQNNASILDQLGRLAKEYGHPKSNEMVNPVVDEISTENNPTNEK